MSHLKPTNDFIFKKIFGESKNEDILKDLLSAILTDIKIDTVKVNKDVSLERQALTEKNVNIFQVNLKSGFSLLLMIIWRKLECLITNISKKLKKN